jgi:hypothetical protein
MSQDTGPRLPLTDDERKELRGLQEAGDESSMRRFYDGCTIGCLADSAEAEVTIDTWGCGSGSTVYLSPDEARREAMSLLAAADHAEFGPGEWGEDGWCQTWRKTP